jgi:hypothetical protein
MSLKIDWQSRAGFPSAEEFLHTTFVESHILLATAKFLAPNWGAIKKTHPWLIPEGAGRKECTQPCSKKIL